MTQPILTDCAECGRTDEVDDDGRCPACTSSAATLEAGLLGLLEPTHMTDEEAVEALAQFSAGIRSIHTYATAQMLTRDRGLVLTMDDGREFQITIVQSR